MFRRFCLQTAEAATGGVLLRKIFLKISQISKAYELESPFNKVAGLQACIFIKKKLQHRCFPVKFAKVLRTPILKIICERLLLRLVLGHFYLTTLSGDSTFQPSGEINGPEKVCVSQYILFRLFTFWLR